MIQVGDTHGRWTVTGPHTDYRWPCRCTVCGAERVLHTVQLGAKKSPPCRNCEQIARVAEFVGRRFGRLTVIGFAHGNEKGRFWLCRCNCGKEVTPRESNLLSGRSASCGCLTKERSRAACKPEDLTGQRFGQLVVVRLYRRGGAGGHARWSCLCDCGKKHIAYAHALKSGTVWRCKACVRANK